MSHRAGQHKHERVLCSRRIIKWSHKLIDPPAIGRVAYLLRHRPCSCQFPTPCLSKPNQLEAVAWVVAVRPRHSVKKR